MIKWVQYNVQAMGSWISWPMAHNCLDKLRSLINHRVPYFPSHSNIFQYGLTLFHKTNSTLLFKTHHFLFKFRIFWYSSRFVFNIYHFQESLHSYQSLFISYHHWLTVLVNTNFKLSIEVPFYVKMGWFSSHNHLSL